MKSIKEIFSSVKAWVRTDGLLHMETSAVITLAVALVVHPFAKLWVVLLCSVLAGLLVGVLKEVYDRVSGKGCAEWHDVICDAIGVAAAALFLILWVAFNR